MPMEDATASDNCGEVTIEVSSETTAGDAAGNYTIVRTFHGDRRCWKQQRLPPRPSRSRTPSAPEFTFVPADYTVECSDEMPMDDATASDNCGEVTIEGQGDDRRRCCGQPHHRSHLHGDRRCWTTAVCYPDHHGPGHHRSEFTFVLADYTVECLDEMPMDDATASDNCGEVTIEVSSETTAGDAAGNYTIVRTFTATDDAGNSSLPPRPSRSRTPPP